MTLAMCMQLVILGKIYRGNKSYTNDTIYLLIFLIKIIWDSYKLFQYWAERDKCCYFDLGKAESFIKIMN